MRSKLIWILFIASSVVGPLAICADAVPQGSAGNKFGVQGGVNFGLGSAYNTSTSIPSRAINGAEIYALPGYRINQWMIGALIGYEFVGQTADPSTVSNQNVGGSGYSVGLAATYDVAKFNFGLSWDILSSYTLSTNASGGQSSIYTAPLPLSFHVLANYRVLENHPEWLVGLFMKLTSYSTSSLGGTSVDVSSNKFTTLLYGVGITYIY